MSNNIVNNYSSTIVTIFQDVIRTYENDLDIIRQREEALNDLNHEAELSENEDMYHGYLLYKEIRDVRRKRRLAKDENLLLKDLYDYLSTQQGQAFKNKIRDIQGRSAKVYEAQQHRTYKPRQKSDMTITEKHAEVVKPFEELLDEFKKTKIEIKNGKLRK